MKGLDSPIAAKGHINATYQPQWRWPWLTIMEVCSDNIVQNGVFVGNAWRHALLIHIGIAAAGSNTEYVNISRLSVEASLIDARCTHKSFV